jgi:protein-S-isoprenylcysteine O-methyltransferase Ste14
MGAVLLGLSGYAWGILHDIAARHRVPRAKPALLLLTGASHIGAWYLLMARSRRFPVPRPLRALALILAPLGFAAMFYSIMVEIPFRKAWVDRGHTDRLVTTGTYALSRHPGVVWYSVAITAAAFATRSLRLLLAAPALIVGDVLHVWFQEQYVLPHEFGEEYERYQETTPFLVPNEASARRFASTLARPETRSGDAPFES